MQTPGRAIFIYVFIGMMVVFGAATAFALIFDIISVNVAERSGEIRLVADRRRRRTSAGRGRTTGRKVVR